METTNIQTPEVFMASYAAHQQWRQKNAYQHDDTHPWQILFGCLSLIGVIAAVVELL